MVNRLVSVLIPSRGRPAELRRTIQAVLDSALDRQRVEITVRVDGDDGASLAAARGARPDGSVFIVVGPRGRGKPDTHLYYNRLAEVTAAPWILVWEDDAGAPPRAWDELLASASRSLLLLHLGPGMRHPAVRREVFTRLRGLSPDPEVGAWLDQAVRAMGRPS